MEEWKKTLFWIIVVIAFFASLFHFYKGNKFLKEVEGKSGDNDPIKEIIYLIITFGLAIALSILWLKVLDSLLQY